MGRSEELSEFMRGAVIGCYLCKTSIREIAILLDIPKSTVSAIITKWKRLGTIQTQPRSGRPRKVTEHDRKVLKDIVSESRNLSLDSITSEFQSSSGVNLSKRTVRRELHGMGIRGRPGPKKEDLDQQVQFQVSDEEV